MSKAVYTAIMELPYVSCKSFIAILLFLTSLIVKKGKARRFLKIVRDGEKRKQGMTKKFKLASLFEFKTAKSTSQLAQLKLCELVEEEMFK